MGGGGSKEEVGCKRVLLLEWHSAKRADGLTSHSWLVMKAQGGYTSELDFVCEGFEEHNVPDPATYWHDIEATLFDDAATTRFSAPITVQELLEVCQFWAQSKYSVTGFNCHIWCLQVWNQVVTADLRRGSYPDQWKMGVVNTLGLGGLFEAEGPTGLEGAVALHFPASRSDERDLKERHFATPTKPTTKPTTKQTRRLCL